MIQHFKPPLFPRFAILLVAFLSPMLGLTPDAKAKEKKNQVQLRLVCVTSLEENQETVLATRDAKGKWRELATISLRSSFVTEGFSVQPGELHISVRENGTLKSISQFTYPAGCRRALAVLLADPEQKTYNTQVVDPEKTKFVKGSVMIFNHSPHTGLLMLGSGEVRVESEKQIVATPDLDESKMYRMSVSYLDADGKTVTCYDRQVPASPDSREILLLLPDKTQGMKVLGIHLFGALD